MDAALRSFGALLLPVSCAGCGRPDRALCTACRRELAGEVVRVDASAPAARGLPVHAQGVYRGGLARALVAYKDRGRRDLAGPLGHALARVVRDVMARRAPGESPDRAAGTWYLVPVPSRRAAVRRRGEDTLLRLARRAARELRATGVPATAARMLCSGPGTVDQAGLGAGARLANARSGIRVRAWHAHRGGAPGVVVLVDDIVTTGASLAASAAALRRAGRPVAGAAVLAATAAPGDAGGHNMTTM